MIAKTHATTCSQNNPTAAILIPVKTTRYNREDRDFSSFVNGELIGFAKTQLQAERLCDDYVYEMLAAYGNTSDLSPEEAADVLTAATTFAA